jgi:hypothetical protein
MANTGKLGSVVRGRRVKPIIAKRDVLAMLRASSLRKPAPARRQTQLSPPKPLADGFEGMWPVVTEPVSAATVERVTRMRIWRQVCRGFLLWGVGLALVYGVAAVWVQFGF